MNTEAVKTFYDLLGHKKQTEIRAIELSKDFKTSKVKGHYFVSSEKEFVSKLQELNGKYNLYAGLNERVEQGTEATDVISMKRIFADIDCIIKPASAEDLQEAEKVTDEIISVIEKQTGLRATKIYSGNGYQLVFCIPEIEITEANREEVQAQVQQFLKDLIKKYSNDKVKLDNVGDLPRIIRITGTTNIKGGKTSEFIEVHKEENSKLRDYILSLKPETAQLTVGELETSLSQILEKDERVKSLFNNEPEAIKKYQSRSEAEQSLVCHLIGLGLDKEQIFKVMASCKIGKWQTANIQYREKTYKTALEIISKEKKDKTQYKKIKLSDLNASLINNFVSVDCQITGEQIQKAIPSDIEVYCETCGKLKKYNSLNNPELFISDKEMKSILQELKDRFACGCAFKEEQTPYKTVTVKKYIDFAVLFVRDLLDRESLTAVKRYEAKKVYVINQTLPNAKTVNLKGRVFIEPKTKNLSIICDSIQHLENQIEDFKITEQFKENSKKYFNSGENIYKQINPDIVGKSRELAKQSIILQLHSPCKIYDIERIKLIRGGLNVLFFGDTKCAKSDLAKDITNKGSIPVGEYTTCETGGRTGFLYTIDKDRNALIWGSLVLNDMGLVVLDGLQSMRSEELGEFREAIEGQEVNVKRSLSGEATARTRILASFNPNKPMNNYIYKCQGIIDSYIFSKTPDITRWDIAIPFCLKDVSSKVIAHRKSGEKPVPQDIFINHIFWVWSRKPEHIIYTDSAVKKINDYSEELIETYSLEVLPLVHNGIRDIITRFSVAMACQMHSTDESHEKIIVETEHVEKAVSWYKEALEMLELAKFKQDTEGKSELTDNDCIAITKELGETEWQILEEIKHEPKSSTQLASLFELSDRTIKEHYKLLKKHELIDTKTKQGISLSIRGVRFVRWGMLSNGEIGKKSLTNKSISEEKLHYCTNENTEGIVKKQETKQEIDFSELDEVFK